MPVRRGRGRAGGRTKGPAAKRRRVDNTISCSEICTSTNDSGLNNASSSSENTSFQPLNVLSSNIGSLVRILTNDSIIIWTDNNTPSISADASSSVSVDSSSSVLTTDLSPSVSDIPGSSVVIQSSYPNCDGREASLQTSETISISSSESSNVESVSSSQTSVNSVAVSSSEDTFVSAESRSIASCQSIEETLCSGSTVCASSDQAVPSVTNNNIEGEAGPSQAAPSEDSKDKCDQQDGDECPVCLQTCVHPAKLPCSHVFCYLCLKGIARLGHSCPMCRAPIPYSYADYPQLVSSQSSHPLLAGCERTDATENYCWFYQGRHGGWWQFEKRMSEEIEENFNSGIPRFEMMICGSMYVIDTASCIQYPKHLPTRSRRLLRELPSRVHKKGVAGIQGCH